MVDLKSRISVFESAFEQPNTGYTETMCQTEFCFLEKLHVVITYNLNHGLLFDKMPELFFSYVLFSRIFFLSFFIPNQITKNCHLTSLKLT